MDDETAGVTAEEVVVATPSSKLDAMYTFLKINFSSLWGEDPATEQ